MYGHSKVFLIKFSIQTFPNNQSVLNIWELCPLKPISIRDGDEIPLVAQVDNLMLWVEQNKNVDSSAICMEKNEYSCTGGI